MLCLAYFFTKSLTFQLAHTGNPTGDVYDNPTANNGGQTGIGLNLHKQRCTSIRSNMQQQPQRSSANNFRQSAFNTVNPGAMMMARPHSMAAPTFEGHHHHHHLLGRPPMIQGGHCDSFYHVPDNEAHELGAPIPLHDHLHVGAAAANINNHHQSEANSSDSGSQRTTNEMISQPSSNELAMAGQRRPPNGPNYANNGDYYNNQPL